MCVTSRTCLDNLSWAFWSRSRTIVAEISRFGEVVAHSGIYEFHNCARGREVSHRELFAKKTFLPFLFVIAVFQSLHMIHDHRWGSEQRQLEKYNFCGVWKLPFCHHWAIKLTRGCLLIRISISLLHLRRSWIPQEATWTYWPAAMYRRLLAMRTGLDLLWDIIPRSC